MSAEIATDPLMLEMCPEGPVGSLVQVRDALRALRAESVTDPITVRIRGGVYRLTEPVTFDARDSGPTTYAAYEGETAIFDGGVPIHNWQRVNVNGRAAWQADVSELLGQLSHMPRSLFVDGQRRPRTRLPRSGAWQSRGTVGSPEAYELYAGSTQVRVPPGCVDANWHNLTDIDLRVLHLWVDERMPIASYDATNSVVTSTHRSMMMLSGESEGWTAERVYVENVFEALTEPGQWYLDRPAGKLYYLPLPGQTPESTPCVLPLTLQFLRLTGDPLRDQWVRGLTFKGLCFRHTDWVQPANDWRRRFDPYCPAGAWHPRDSFEQFIEGNHVDPDQTYATVPQAAHNVPGAVHLLGAQHCTFEKCRIEHVGFYAFEVGDGCSDITIDHCTMHDLGAGGINIDGGNLHSDPRRYTHDCRFTDNHIAHAGQVFHAACGILLCHGFDHLIARNHIHDLCYTGISVGWEWTRQPHITRQVVVEGNHIHDIGGTDGLSDLGGIYTLGIQPGTVLRGNCIHDIHAHAYGGWGIYTDASSAHLIVEHNVIFNTGGQCINNNTGNCENLIRFNTLLGTTAAAINIARRPAEWTDALRQSVACTIFGNVIITRSQPAFSMRAHEGGDLRDYTDAFTSDANIFWDVAAAAAPVMLGDWRDHDLCDWGAWHALGHDRHSRAQPSDLSHLPEHLRPVLTQVLDDLTPPLALKG